MTADTGPANVLIGVMNDEPTAAFHTHTHMRSHAHTYTHINRCGGVFVVMDQKLL